MKIAYTPEHQRTARSATAKTAHRWRKRMKVQQLKIQSLEESARGARADMERLLEEVRRLRSERAVVDHLRTSMLETRTHGHRAWR